VGNIALGVGKVAGTIVLSPLLIIGSCSGAERVDIQTVEEQRIIDRFVTRSTPDWFQNPNGSEIIGQSSCVLMNISGYHDKARAHDVVELKLESRAFLQALSDAVEKKCGPGQTKGLISSQHPMYLNNPYKAYVERCFEGNKRGLRVYLRVKPKDVICR